MYPNPRSIPREKWEASPAQLQASGAASAPGRGRRLAAASGPRGACGGRVQGARSGSGSERSGRGEQPGAGGAGGQAHGGDAGLTGRPGHCSPWRRGRAALALARRSHRISAPWAHGGEGRGTRCPAAMEPAPSADAVLQPLLLANASDAFPSAFPSTGANASGPPATRSASSLALAIAITALYSAVCAVGLLGNVLVMFGIVR